MDFVEGIPLRHWKNVLLVVVDRFSKYARFLPLSHTYTTVSVARLFFDNIFKLHGLPESIVSDRDPIFTGSFWRELFHLSGSQLCFSSSYHPQSNGQTKVVNRIIVMCLRCFSGDYPKKWVDSYLGQNAIIPAFIWRCTHLPLRWCMAAHPEPSYLLSQTLKISFSGRRTATAWCGSP